MLFLDDSGRPSARDSSTAVVIGGFAIPSARVPVRSRRIAGAKARFYPHRGDPGRWDVKATHTIKPNAWKRSKNRQVLAEAGRILRRLDGTVYSVSIDKRRLNHLMSLSTTRPLQLPVLVEHFAADGTAMRATGRIV